MPKPVHQVGHLLATEDDAGRVAIHVGGPQLTQPLDEAAVKGLVRDLCTWLVLRSPPHPEPDVGTTTVPLGEVCGFLLAEGERCETEQGGRIPRATTEALRQEFGPVADTDTAEPDRAPASNGTTQRLAQGLRLIRDSTSGYPANVAARALREASVLDGRRYGVACEYLAQWFVREMFETQIADFDPPWEFVEACVDVMAPPCPGASAAERQQARDELTDYWPDYRPTT